MKQVSRLIKIILVTLVTVTVTIWPYQGVALAQTDNSIANEVKPEQEEIAETLVGTVWENQRGSLFSIDKVIPNEGKSKIVGGRFVNCAQGYSCYNVVVPTVGVITAPYRYSFIADFESNGCAQSYTAWNGYLSSTLLPQRYKSLWHLTNGESIINGLFYTDRDNFYQKKKGTAVKCS